MDEQTTVNAERPREQFPQNWQIASDYDPNDHLMNLKGRDYLNVQNRMLWFIRDQRAFTVAGLAKMPYVIRTELVEMDREGGWAHFKTYVRDVLGNESTMYGSESAKDFGDFAEKASTKSLGRALLALGYGTAFAPEMDEGDRVVDAPVDRRRSAAPRGVSAPSRASGAPAAAGVGTAPKPLPTAAAATSTAHTTGATAGGGTEQPATEQQMVSIHKLCAALGKTEPEERMTYNQAKALIVQLSGEYQRARRAS